MHPSAYNQMRRCVDEHVPGDKRLTVVDFGSRTTPDLVDSGMIHRRLLGDRDIELIGVDIAEGPNVDVVMTKPYRVPLKSGSVDLVISGQVFEHIPFFWASLLEIGRLLKPGGLFLMTVPSRGHPHTMVDCWRYYPDGVRAMAAWAGLEIVEASTDFPPTRGGPRHRYGLIQDPHRYWGDTVGVFRKPARYSRRIALVRVPLLWWANHATGSFSDSIEARRRARGHARAARARDAVAPLPRGGAGRPTVEAGR